MINRFFFLLAASIFLFGNISRCIASGGFPTYTQHTPMELKPASLNPQGSFQVASVCFLGAGDCVSGGFNKGDNDMTVDTVKQCLNEGFAKTFCSIPYYLYGSCPYDGRYYKECRKDNARACKDSGYSTNCGTGYIPDTSQVCPYDSSYKKCKCNPCSGYDYTYAQANAEGYQAGASCNSCGTMKYQRQNAACSGFLSCECGGEIGAAVCYSGSVQKFNKCHSCCAYECSLASCRIGNTCRYEACSNKYCITGCIAGFGMSNGVCRAKCQIGWIYYADGTCVTPTAHNPSKVALGIVVYVNPDGIGGQVMSAWPIDANGNKSSRNVGISWANGFVDNSELPNYTNKDTAMVDFNSCNNTDKMPDGKVKYPDGTAIDYPAARATRNYAPTIETKGKWCLPAAGIVASIFNNQSVIDVGISKLGGVTCRNSMWSSSEYDLHWAWIFTNGLEPTSKPNDNYVRPVLEF